MVTPAFFYIGIKNIFYVVLNSIKSLNFRTFSQSILVTKTTDSIFLIPMRYIVMLFLMTSLKLSSQHLEYEVVKGNRPIGHMSVHRSVSTENEEITIVSNVEFKVLVTFVVEYSLHEIFEYGQLVSGGGYNSLNGAVQKETRVEKKQQDYIIRFDGVPSHLNEKSIRYSVSQIYFTEPYDGQKVFSQHFGKYLVFQKTGPATYRLESPDGENLYTYENGYITQVKVTRDYATFYFVIRPETLARIKDKADTVFHKK